MYMYFRNSTLLLSSMAAVSDENPKSSECEDVFGGPVFEPRLYVQRYYYVQQELAKFCVKHVSKL